MLDIACGHGRHAIAAAKLGADVVAVDADPIRLEAAEKAARTAGVRVRWVQSNLDQDPLPRDSFELVMVFNYLDRKRMTDFLATVAPRGHFMCETFHEQQRDMGWGPTSPQHLLKPSELLSLVGAFEIVLARDVIETIDGRQMALASILARRPQEPQ